MKKIVQRIFVRLNPETDKVKVSCTKTEGSVAIYVANYPGGQNELEEDYKKQLI